MVHTQTARVSLAMANTQFLDCNLQHVATVHDSVP